MSPQRRVAASFVQICSAILLQAHVVRDKAGMKPKVSAAFAAKCFPDLVQHGGSQPVQLYISLLTEDATESVLTAAGER
jgi:hypothetical protein